MAASRITSTGLEVLRSGPTNTNARTTSAGLEVLHSGIASARASSLGVEVLRSIDTSVSLDYTFLASTGARDGMWTVTTDHLGQGGNIGAMVNGSNAVVPGTSFFIGANNPVAGKHVTFDFEGPARVVSGFRLITSSANAGGTSNYQFQGFNGTSWIDIDTTFSLTNQNTTFDVTFANQTPYQSYRFLGVSGTTANWYWVEIEFASNGVPLERGDRRSAISVATNATGTGTLSTILDAASTQGYKFTNAQNAAGLFVDFTFNRAVTMHGAYMAFDLAAAGLTNGTWKWQRSDDNGGTWVDISSPFTWTVAKQTTFHDITNSTASNRYRILGISGTTTGTPFFMEALFALIPDPIGGTTPHDLAATFLDDAQFEAGMVVTPAHQLAAMFLDETDFEGAFVIGGNDHELSATFRDETAFTAGIVGVARPPVIQMMVISTGR